MAIAGRSVDLQFVRMLGPSNHDIFRGTSGSFNAMVSHRVRRASVKDVNREFVGWLKKAYEA